MGRIKESRFWDPLWRRYCGSPSEALCRVPELEYASRIVPGVRMLDHCCGDGKFAEMAWPGCSISAGCDRHGPSVDVARRRGNYARVDQCDVSQRLPYADCSFDVVFNNSALEHIQDLDAALREVARVTKPGGEFVFNVLNHRYFDWWPLDGGSCQAYRKWQPFVHALNEEQWRARLAAGGFQLTSVAGYFDRSASRVLARLDCDFSGANLAGRYSRFVAWYRVLGRVAQSLLRWSLGRLTWETTPDGGAGYCIRAVRYES